MKATLGSNRSKAVADMRRRDGFYRLVVDGEEKKFVSVTTVLNVLAKPALVTWAAKAAANLVLDDPEQFNTAEKAAGGIYGQRDKAADRGSTIHSIAEACLNGADLDIEELPEKFKGYVGAFRSWLASVPGLEVIQSEATLYNTVHGYAGTTDLICRIGELTYLIDFKTGKGIYDEFGVQLAAYKDCDLLLPKTEPCKDCGGFGCELCNNTGRTKGTLQSSIPIDKTAVILLQDSGRFQFGELDAPLEVFLSLKRVWQWQKGIV